MKLACTAGAIILGLSARDVQYLAEGKVVSLDSPLIGRLILMDENTYGAAVKQTETHAIEFIEQPIPGMER